MASLRGKINIERSNRIIASLYTAVFEKGKGTPVNAVFRKTFQARESIILTEDSYGITVNGAGGARAYADLTIAGTDNDPGASIYGITSSVARVRYNSRVLDSLRNGKPTTGWAVFRLNLNWAATTGLSRNPTVLLWGTSGGNRLQLYYLDATNEWSAIRVNSGSGAQAKVAGGHSAAGDVTLAIRWTGSEVGISLNGAAFVTAANTNIPDLSASTVFDIGTSGAANQDLLDGGVRWAFAGIGELADADVSTFHGFGNTDPSISAGDWSALPNFGTTLPTFAWLGVDNTHTAPSIVGGANVA